MEPLDINIINPYIRRAIYSIIPKNMGIPSRVILDYEIIHYVEGDLTLIYGSQTYIPEPGQFILLRPGISHAVLVEKSPLNQPHIHFDPVFSQNSLIRPIIFNDYQALLPFEKALLQKDLFSDYPATPYISFKDHTKAAELFYGVIDLYNSNQLLLAKCQLISLLNMLIADNFPDLLPYSGHNNNIAYLLKSYIDASNNFNMSLDDFENFFSYNKFYLEKQFKKIYSTSIIAYQNSAKMSKARELLKTDTVTAVAEKLNFSSVYTFSRAFKNAHGYSPSEYKKSLFSIKT